MMSTFRAYFKKEILESIRQYRYVIIGAVIPFFSIADPVMLKLLPSIIKNETNMDISAFIPKTTAQVFQNYIKDMFQIANIVIVFALSGTLGKEIAEEKLLFPYSQGCSPSGMVLAKAVHHILTTTIITFIGFSINYYYVNILYTNRTVDYSNLMKSAACMSLYFALNISLTMLFSSFIKKEFATGILVLFLTYFSMAFSSIKSVYEFLPGYLVTAANSFGTVNITKISIVTIIVIVSCYYISFLRMEKVAVI